MIKHCFKFNFPLFIVISILFISCGTTPYTSIYGTYNENKNDILFTLGNAFVPNVINNTYKLRDFVSSEYLKYYKKRNGDVATVDEIYRYSLWLTDGDIEQSLFAISIATLPYKSTPAKLPLLKIDMMFYFSFESDSLFLKRYHNLPSHLFADSPKNPFGDKDKLPHFFGSAFLGYITGTKWFPNITGVLIEYGEAIFNIEGFLDERDIATNRLGADFGITLLRESNTLPSKFFRNQELNKTH